MRTALLAVAAVLALTGCAGAAPAGPAPTPAGPPAAVETAVPAPASLSIPAIGASSSLVPTGVNPDGTAEVPPVSMPEQASYYRLGPNPGSVGRAVLLGHVNGNGRPGVFARLDELRPEAIVEVTRTDGAVARFIVTRVESFPKDRFPTEQVWGPTSEREVALVTCGGEFVGGDTGYEDNIIAFGKLV